MTLNPYLFFVDQCEAAFKFYAQLLGAEILMMQKLGDSPMAAGAPASSHGMIIHARLAIGDQLLMGSDSPKEHFEKPQGYAVTLGVDTPAEAERVFKALAEGGSIKMPLEKTFWAERFGMLVDRYGISWMINCETPA
ncbi:MAG: VOC family protein [Nevskia sp.]